jgi:hypothetical protein
LENRKRDGDRTQDRRTQSHRAYGAPQKEKGPAVCLSLSLSYVLVDEFDAGVFERASQGSKSRLTTFRMPLGSSRQSALFEAVRIVDMSASNAWAEFAGMFMRTREAAYLEHEKAKAELKSLIPEHAYQAIGRGIRAKRSKSGAINFDLVKVEEESHATQRDHRHDRGCSSQGACELTNLEKSLVATIEIEGRGQGKERSFPFRYVPLSNGVCPAKP